MKEINFDRPERIDFDEVYQDLNKLINGEITKIPIYNMSTSKREKNIFNTIIPGDLIILEGIYSLFDDVLIF